MARYNLKIGYILTTDGRNSLSLWELSDIFINWIINNNNLAVQVLKDNGINNSQGLIDQLVTYRDLNFITFESLGRDRVGNPQVYVDAWNFQRVSQIQGIIPYHTYTSPQ